MEDFVKKYKFVFVSATLESLKKPLTPHMLQKIVQMFGKDGKNLINLRFV